MVLRSVVNDACPAATSLCACARRAAKRALGRAVDQISSSVSQRRAPTTNFSSRVLIGRSPPGLNRPIHAMNASPQPSASQFTRVACWNSQPEKNTFWCVLAEFQSGERHPAASTAYTSLKLPPTINQPLRRPSDALSGLGTAWGTTAIGCHDDAVECGSAVTAFSRLFRLVTVGYGLFTYQSWVAAEARR